MVRGDRAAARAGRGAPAATARSWTPGRRRILGTMRWGEVWVATRRTARALTSAGQTGARGVSRVGGGTTRVVHRMTRASGAGRTGLSSLIELTAVGSAGDAFVAVALAGTLFFSVSLDEARWRVALALLLTMAPFAV